MLDRLKSPVVVIQLITILTGVVIFFAPQVTEEVKYVTGAIIAIYSIFAGLNNPVDKKNF